MAAAAAARVGIEWSTPARELDRLHTPFVREMGDAASLSRAPIDVLGIVAEYGGLPFWYTALERLDLLQRRIPALPRHIHQILKGKCPLPKRAGQELKPDGTPWKVSDTHSLYLIPAGTLNDLETRASNYGRKAINAHGERLYPNENPFGFRYFVDAVRQEHGDVSFEAEWILMSNDVLKGSRSQSWNDQVKIIQNLSREAFVEYQVPSAKQAFGFMILHKVATGESLYQSGNERNHYLYTYTRVQETTGGYHLVVGGSAPSGVNVSDNYGCDSGDIGVAALRKF